MKTGKVCKYQIDKTISEIDYIVCFVFLNRGTVEQGSPYIMLSCFQHFFLNNSVTLDIIELIFGNGCPNAIFEHVFEKKEEQIR